MTYLPRSAFFALVCDQAWFWECSRATAMRILIKYGVQPIA
jgi:hypothetical protein